MRNALKVLAVTFSDKSALIEGKRQQAVIKTQKSGKTLSANLR